MHYSPYAVTRVPYGYYAGSSRACLKEGAKGADVDFLHSKLYELGWVVGQPDDWKAGYAYGPIGKQAVEMLQAAEGLKVDGVVGPDTWKALGETGSSCSSGGSRSRSYSKTPAANGLGTYTTPFYRKPWFMWTVGGLTVAAVAALILAPKKGE